MEDDKQTEKESEVRQIKRGSELCIPLARPARERRRRVAGCSVYYPQAIWVGKLLGCGGIHLCVCVCVCGAVVVLPGQGAIEGKAGETAEQMTNHILAKSCETKLKARIRPKPGTMMRLRTSTNTFQDN
ncbi:hypothetical protein JOB18_041627 [Solea senegalensis]|uniref:Uncharacterized protein n=1 Tax=Solea senegalensis TaxID=28829 RepID=A0AAV6ST25_SOLSE|nr:hypothetical protein JOB18_041627 [Solea senegalensis]